MNPVLGATVGCLFYRVVQPENWHDIHGHIFGSAAGIWFAFVVGVFCSLK